MKNISHRKLLFLSASIFSLLFLANLSASGQATKRSITTRSITSDDFTKKRPAVNSVRPGRQSSDKRKVRRASYQYVKREKGVVRRKTSGKTNKAVALPAKKPIEIGVTMWRLRQPLPDDSGPKLPVQMADGSRQMWTPERVGADTVFQKGDRVRLAFESSVKGYLYVINSEFYTDGSFGAPSLIFPASADEDNAVQSGLLVDIPDQTEDLPYFVIDPKKANYAGELLTVIVSPKRLTNLETNEEGKITNLEALIALETNAETDIFSRLDVEDKTYTPAEAEAACGSKTRDLVREKTKSNPCGTKTRSLTREAPLPQMIYRVKAQTGQPAVAFIRLNVRQ